MKKKILLSGFIACVLLASCAREKEGVTDDTSTLDSTSTLDTTAANVDTSAARPGNLPTDPKVDVNNYKHPNLSKEAQKNQDAADGKPVDVVYKKDTKNGNYKDNSSSSETVKEKANTSQNKVETGNSSDGGNYKNQQK